MPETLDVLGKRWKSVSKVVFGQDVGPLSDYSQWLSEFVEKPLIRKSSISGKSVAYAIHEYAEGSKWASLDEIDFESNYEPPNLSQIKKAEELAENLRDRFYYTGNIVLGNSGNVEGSSNISDSFFLDNCTILGDSKYLQYCSFGRLCEDSFGTYGPGESQYCIHSTQTYRQRRCFEVWTSQNCSDAYYCYNLNNCSDCIFCFNLKNKKYCIGNREVPPETYQKVKSNLLAEMAQSLKKNKRLPTLLEIAGKCKFAKPKVKEETDYESYEGDSSAIEKEFSGTSKLVLGAELRGMDNYKGWLERHTEPIKTQYSAASGKRLLMVGSMISVQELPSDRMLSIGEAEKLGQTTMATEEQAEKITLGNAHESIAPIAFLNVDFRQGTNSRLVESTTCIESASCYKCSGAVYAKHCGYTWWPRSSNNCFGCDTVFDSSFCINCYHSVKLTRCFEMDSCRSCADSMFCHNSENLDNCMFCFNTKSKRYAIGNVGVGRENYLKIKKIVLDELAGRLEKEKDLDISIYNVGSKK